MILAIIQHIPAHPRRAVRTGSFAQFQQLCGMIEKESYLAAHAACHATMNGMARIIAADADISSLDSVLHALELVVDAGPFDALVLPGLTDFSRQCSVCERCLFIDDFDFRLFLDPERRADIDTIIAHQKQLPGFATFAWPWVNTVTPGRRSSECLPPSCVMAPLALKTTPYLRGTHELCAVSPCDGADLREAGIEVMSRMTVQRRPVIGLVPSGEKPVSSEMRADARVSPAACTDEAPDIETRIDRELHERCDDLIEQYPRNDASLWSALQRTAISVLSQAQSRGWILRYRVRCDAETASWGTPEVPVVEVRIEYPKRVREIRFSVR